MGDSFRTLTSAYPNCVRQTTSKQLIWLANSRLSHTLTVLKNRRELVLLPWWPAGLAPEMSRPLWNISVSAHKASRLARFFPLWPGRTLLQLHFTFTTVCWWLIDHYKCVPSLESVSACRILFFFFLALLGHIKNASRQRCAMHGKRPSKATVCLR